MNIKSVRMASTRLDRHNERIAKQALEIAAKQLNDGETTIPHTMEHDNTIPPMGKVINAKVEKHLDGAYELIADIEFFEGIERLSLENGETLLRQKSAKDKRPFSSRYAKMDEVLSIGLDWNNFDKKNFEVFLEDVKNESGVAFSHFHIGRKSAIPDPELVINSIPYFATLITGYLAIKKTKVGEKIDEIASQELEKFYNFVKSLIVQGGKYLIPANRPQTYIFVMCDEPEVEFIARTTDAVKVVSAIKMNVVEKQLQEIGDLVASFKATRIQYLLDDDGTWKFNYLLTENGEVVGTEKSYSKRATRFKNLQNNARLRNQIEKSVEKLLSKKNS